MANWNGTARTNYVLPVNVEALEKVAKRFDLRVIHQGERIGFVTETDDGGWPSNVYDDELEDDVEFDISTMLMPHIKEGEVLVLMEAGSEKSRYVSGYAQAHVRNGDVCRMVSISLSDIFAKAATEFSVDVNSITDATY
ncbi:hypothetical protein A8H39_00210 [Paraburkholderia fungorum]|uniref:hypothetical protein n=1 Tax=Paraburkholderia fungorum TaxID=134537 RepID=UPI0004801E2E|nr:hypothetical protein [Paraburkholderia fungorum]MBB5546509.1 hypothetical protein [Paraburkholderia fungorum]PNE59606.1 hypothetical protein A8H39_00210 [Paraburkholderia fungorum]